MKTDNKLKLNCHNEAAQNVKRLGVAEKCSRECSTRVNFFFLGAVEVSPRLFSGVCSLHQGPTGGEVRGVEVSAKEVIGRGVDDSIPQADSSLSISWRDPN